MSEAKRIKTALVSVYHKEGLDEIITKLHEEGVEFLSTGGTRQFIESLGFPCKAVEDRSKTRRESVTLMRLSEAQMVLW